MNELIEKHAVAVATAHLVGLGYKVTDVGSTQSFDLDARRGLDRLKVEVKGTTSSGSHVILTRAEVALHKTAYPNNALAIVHSIELDRTSEPSAADRWRPRLAEAVGIGRPRSRTLCLPIHNRALGDSSPGISRGVCSFPSALLSHSGRTDRPAPGTACPPDTTAGRTRRAA